MACSTLATWLHSSSSVISHSLLPFLFRRRPTLLPSNLRPLMSTPNRLRNPLMEVHAQAKRGFSVKEDEVASPADLSFEAPLKIVEYPDPILRTKNKRIDTFDDNLKKLVDEMFDVMYNIIGYITDVLGCGILLSSVIRILRFVIRFTIRYAIFAKSIRIYETDGIGLSAPQVGINVQLMVFNPVGERGEGEEIILVNPRVSKYSKKVVLFNEGCLSFPGIYADVERPESVKIDARDITGARFVFNLSDLPARVFQHEFDHLQGILFCDRMTEEVLDNIRAELQALEKKYEDKTGNPSPENIASRQRRKVAAGFGKS
ncbi:hypothetical protein TEA_004325 [Camellia sinensis var. sinensis]|uniref:Peptide deformylase n=1 Tax=Camellia sinensis var. sinensis TaxID=542762 RepID=A0A4S4DHW5_CAMSN|nr:hypothetical protein TEA_004325 [Camellia sinensis var. sinensis]